jgi:hypothetical protein
MDIKVLTTLGPGANVIVKEPYFFVAYKGVK